MAARKFLLFLCLACLCWPAQIVAQTKEGFLARWQGRATATQAEQPHWITPLATVTPLLEQEFRSDFTHRTESAGAAEWNYGGGKGLELIPLPRVELLFNVPPYRQYNSVAQVAGAHNGFGDVSLKMKYRILSRNAMHGNYVLTAFFGGSLPTGSYNNGGSEATVAPALAAGKGFGRWDVQTTVGAVLPVANSDRLGRPILWNAALQYHAPHSLWPELETNATYFRGGPNDGKTQNFLTPGLVTHFPLRHRLGLTLGVGMQFATSQFHEYTRAIIFSGRLPF